ncbi:MAG: Uma2 family endonuclease [Pseudomonadota bacterium]|nr:Uma2 family endonuclease [Pseudomonadota bacterium]
MSLARQHQGVSVEEYLRNEERAERKHEYLNGEVWAMVGATDNHVTVAGNLFVQLRQVLKPGDCRSYISGMKLHVQSADAYFYPDVMVCCDPADRENRLAKEHPVFIAEVLSSSTEAFDRGRKFSIYRQIDSLRHYWLIDTERRSVDAFTRAGNGEWRLRGYSPGDDQVKIDALDCRIAMATLFEGIEPDEITDANETEGDAE